METLFRIYTSIVVMKGFEGVSAEKEIQATPHLERLTTNEEIKDRLFDEYMKQRLLEDFFDELTDYIGDEETDKMRGALATMSDENVYAALSLPHELRERKFEEWEEKINSKEETAETLIRRLATLSESHGFSIGYHTSPVEIKPTADGKWSIKGTEIDHRDDDRMMAYYSTKYRHLFKKKSPEHIYIVRTDAATHKTDGNWSRGAELSIVAKIPFEDVFEYVEKTSRTYNQKEGVAGEQTPS